MAIALTKQANEVFSPVDAAGAVRRVDNGETQRWGSEVERILYGLIAEATGLELPNLLVKLTITGGGPNNWTATSNLPIPMDPTSALYLVYGISADNTGPVTINGKPWRTAYGNEFVPSGIKAGGMYIIADNGSEYRSLTDQEVSALVAAAEDAANAAMEAEDWARKWATENEDVPVDDGTHSGFSAYHWAQKAMGASGIVDWNFGTRASAVSEIAGGFTLANGKVIVAGGLMYTAQSGATAIADMPGFVPTGDVFSPEHFGAAANGSTNDAAAINAATAYAGSLPRNAIVDGLGKSYKVNATIVLGTHTTIRRMTIDFTGAPTNAALFQAFGTLSADVAMTSNAGGGTNQFNVATPAAFNTNDVIFVRSTNLWAADSPSDVHRGETVRIVGKSGSTLTVDTTFAGTIQPSASGVVSRLEGMREIVIEDINAIGGGQSSNHRFADVRNAVNVRIENNEAARFAHSGVYMETVYSANIGKNLISWLDNAALGYGIVFLRACRACSVYHNTISYCRVGISIGGTQGVSKDMKWVGNTINAPYTAGINSKGASVLVTIVGNTINGDMGVGGGLGDGILFRGTHATIADNIIKNVARFGIMASLYGVGSHYDLTVAITGNIIERTDSVGILVQPGEARAVAGASITGNVVRECLTAASTAIMARSQSTTQNIVDTVIVGNTITRCEGDGITLSGVGSTPGVNSRAQVGTNAIRLSNAAISAGKQNIRVSGALDAMKVSMVSA